MKKAFHHGNIILSAPAGLFFLLGAFACAQETTAKQPPGPFSAQIYYALERKGIDGLKEVISNDNISQDRTYSRQLEEISRELDLLEERRSQDAQNALKKKQEEFAKHFPGKSLEDPDSIGESIRLRWEMEEYSKQLQTTERISFESYDADLIFWLQKNAEGHEWKKDEEYNLSGYCLLLKKLYSDREEVQSCLMKLKDRSAVEKTFRNKKLLQYYGREKNLFSTIKHTLNIIDLRYIEKPDYQKMQAAVFRRCRLIGELLTDSGNNYCFKYQNLKVRRWKNSISDMERQSGNSTCTKESIMDLFHQLDSLNTACLKIPKEALFSVLLEAVCYQLDSYTELIWPWDRDDFRKEMFQEYVGIGVVLKKNRKDLVISDVYPDSPACHHSLHPNDVILEIGGHPAKVMSLHAAVKNLTEPQSIEVNLKTMNPVTKETKSLTIQKTRILLPTVYSFRLRNPGESLKKMYCIKIVQFNNSTAQEYQKSITEIEKEGIDGLIIDLRSNTGGVLSEALEIAEMYAGKGIMLISQPRCGPASYYTASRNDMERTYPIVILINNLTASSAEVLAGILRNSASGRALLVGQNSFGKNCVQMILSLEEDTSLLKFTHAQYRLPLGKQKNSPDRAFTGFFDEQGLRPDVSISLFPHENEEINEFYRISSLYHYSSEPCKGISIHELHSIDPQMTIGYYILNLLTL